MFRVVGETNGIRISAPGLITPEAIRNARRVTGHMASAPGRAENGGRGGRGAASGRMNTLLLVLVLALILYLLYALIRAERF
ncbi:hypothetical protein GCM10008961_16570 [Deinococcus knuensis]|uniref:K(+)-transporting ATPase subunit F n=1 Tax=Deinococcus knuensis TaxID=1837380 RepID=A0ABQ2SEL0_9DEIO|nr:hypothetical protein GCM10008961_16570 [Deinococcus knuensis]